MGCSLFYFKFVADPPHSGQVPAAVVFDLFADSLDMDVYSPCITNIFISPYLIQKLLACEYLIRRSGKEIEKFQFLWRHFDILSIYDDGIIRKINNNTRVFYTFSFIRRTAFRLGAVLEPP